MEWAIVGDDEPVALADRPAVKAIQAEPDPRRALALWAQMVVEVAARVAPISEVLTAAADADPAAAQLLADADRHRMSGATEFVRYLASLDGLAPASPSSRPPTCAGPSWTATSTDCLVAQRGWTTTELHPVAGRAAWPRRCCAPDAGPERARPSSLPAAMWTSQALNHAIRGRTDRTNDSLCAVSAVTSQSS